MHLLYPKSYLEKCGAKVEEGTAFVIMPFRNEFVSVLDAIKTGLEQLSIKVIRADDLNLKGEVIADILTGIAQADFVIADLSGQNPNVFYELGICHAVKEDVILLAQNPKKTPFDLRHLRCIAYEHSERGLRNLSAQLRSTVQDLLERRRRKTELDFLAQLASLNVLKVSDWFSGWIRILTAIAGWPELQGNDPAEHSTAVVKAASVLWEFRGGAYTLDEEGTILGSFPVDIRGQNYSHREYFRLCSSRRTGVVSNSFDSANREHPISVIAVPRTDSNGHYLGILDAVLDIDESPLNSILQTSLPGQPAWYENVHVILIDQRRVVIAATLPGLSGRSLGGATLIQLLGESLSGSYELTDGGAVASPVENTPFICLATTAQVPW